MFGKNFLKLFTSRETEIEKARLEAFLKAVPEEYCGWMSDGSIAYSPGFANLLDLSEIENITDIEGSLSPADAAVLEGLFMRLQDKKEPFEIDVRTASTNKTLRMSGTIGQDRDQSLTYDILWIRDISDIKNRSDENARKYEDSELHRTRLQSALDQLPEAVWLRDEDGEIVWCNKSYASLLDSTPASVIADKQEILLRPMKRPSGNVATTTKKLGKELAREALDTKESQTSLGHAILGGKRQLVCVKETVTLGGQYTLGILKDITREEEMQEEHIRNVSAHKELLEQLAAAVVIFNVDQKLEFYNSAFSQLWQIEESYLNKSPKLGDLMENLRETRRLPEQADFRSFKQSWLNMFTSLIDPYEEMLYLPDGTALRMLFVPHSMGGLMMIFEDVTSRLELESSYNTLIAVQKETLDNLREGVVVYGGDGRIKLWNPAFANLWNLAPETLDGEPHVTKIIEKMKAKVDESEWESVKEELLTQSLNRTPRDGRITLAGDHLIEFSTMPLPDGRVLVTQVDVTDTVHVENALRERNAALQAADQIKADFLSNVSYQLRTPLNAIMGFAEILAQEYFGNLNNKQKEYTDGIQEAGQKLIHLIDDILDLTSIEAGTLELQLRTISLNDTIQSMFDLVRDWARKEDIEFTLDLCTEEIQIEADQRRLKQILINLIRNAITHTPAGGKIIIKTEQKNDTAFLYVIDNGTGISEEDQKRIFSPFERAKDSLRTSAGLGLSLVKNIINLHHGNITLESEHSTGTSVTVTLPVSAPAAIAVSADLAGQNDEDASKKTKTTKAKT